MKVFVAIPCMEDMPVDFVMSLTNMKMVGETSINYSVSSLVYDSRNRLAQMAIDSGSDYVLWLDSDMVFDPSLLERLMVDIEDKDFVSALYFMRKPPFKPLIFKTIRPSLIANEGVTVLYEDYPVDSTFEIDGCGFGAVLMRTQVLRDVQAKDRFLFSPLLGYGEDVSFCIRVKRAGYQMWCDSKLLIGHIGKMVTTDNTFKMYNKK